MNDNLIDVIKSNAADKKEFKGEYIYLFYKDEDVPIFMKFLGKTLCQFQDTGLNNIGWNITTIEFFYEKYIKTKNDILEYIEVSRRVWGEPKLSKPKELNGIKPIFSIKNGYRKNQVFIKNNDIWIKDNDYFSTEISQEEAKKMGLNINIRPKFVYNDNFASVTLRGEGWIRIKNLLLFIMDKNLYFRLNKRICKFYKWKYPNIGSDWDRFYNDLIFRLKNMDKEAE